MSRSTHDPDRYERIHAILKKARILTGPRRAELDDYLAKTCGDDEALRSEVLALLAAGLDGGADDPFADEFLQAMRVALEDVASDWMPDRIGDYTILRQIGRGGMGVVYEAEQASPQRRVAIKLLHPLHATPERLRRFRHEVALLGRLQHPGIAQIYEASTYDVGRGPQPFFAMELVEGVDIRTHCERRELDRAGRLELLARVADAVQHAHDHGITHRDLKPDNVLVDTRGHPRILDFGVAHASKGSIALSSVLTEEGQLIGTLAYMAPEQLSAKGGSVTPRVDVFALGVLGFELLLGRLPREVEDLPLPQMIAHLGRAEPPRAGTLDRNLRGEVETILGKALETDPARRYDSAAAFAGDLRRHLEHHPIRAHPPSRLYLARKFMHRNRVLVAGTATTLLVAVIGAVVATRFALDATQRADELELRTTDIMRLSLAQNYEDLVSGAGALWPPYPDRIVELTAWVADARAVAEELPSLIAKREELRGLALPQSAEELRAERESHPDFAELQRLQGELVYRRRALAQRKDGESVPLPKVDWDTAPAGAAELAARARALVHPGRASFGDEPLGLVLAEKAIELAPDGQRSELAATLSQAYFALGRDEEALSSAYLALDEAPPGEWKAVREAAFTALERAATEASSEQGIAAEEERVAALASRALELEQRVGERRTWTFPVETEAKTRARWWHNQLTGLIGELESLNAPGSGLLAEGGVSEEHGWSVVRRLAFARRLEAGFAAGGELAVRWEQDLPSIHAAYPGLDLAPQMGLVPIGADPRSGLWEFWHVQTGAEPPRDSEGRLALEADSGLVFVLLPRSKFWMGAQRWNPQAPNYDVDAEDKEGPVHEVELSAFFMSKYEMTQGQWQRMTGRDPSRWNAATLTRDFTEGVHPVEQVSWFDCVERLRTQGLVLPSEAQWEYACRGGTDTPRPFAFENFSISANLADQSHARRFPAVTFVEPWDDGMPAHGPVGRLAPNPFGLHDVIGNVWEWCLDGFDADFYSRSAPQDPVNPRAGFRSCVYRGGGCINTAVISRSALRYDDAPSLADIGLGVRPARVVGE